MLWYDIELDPSLLANVRACEGAMTLKQGCFRLKLWAVYRILLSYTILRSKELELLI
jgi:hypothetical protein